MRLLTRWRALIVGLAVSLLTLLCLLAIGRNRALTEHDRENGAARMIAIRCGRLIDGKNDIPTTNSTILIEGERITAVGREVKIPAGADVIDLSQATVLPGLIDAHTHLTYHYDTQPNETPDVTAKYAAENARLTLEAGFTTVRNLGASGGADFNLRDRINRGETPGPRILASGAPLIARPPNIMASGPNPNDPRERIFLYRRFVRAQILLGADVIKIFVTAGTGGDSALLFTEEEIRAVVDEASKAHLRVAAHAHSTEGIKAAVRAGVTSVEHASYLDDEAIKLMIAGHVAMVPTLYLPNHYLANKKKFGFDQAGWQRS